MESCKFSLHVSCSLRLTFLSNLCTFPVLDSGFVLSLFQVLSLKLVHISVPRSTPYYAWTLIDITLVIITIQDWLNQSINYVRIILCTRFTFKSVCLKSNSKCEKCLWLFRSKRCSWNLESRFKLTVWMLPIDCIDEPRLFSYDCNACDIWLTLTKFLSYERLNFLRLFNNRSNIFSQIASIVRIRLSIVVWRF